MFNNWQYRILAVILALACWYVVTGREKVDAWVEISVELIGVPTKLHIREGLPSRVDVLVRGPKSMVRALDPKTLAYPLDLSGLTHGENSIALKPEKVPVQSALQVIEVSPPRITLDVEPLLEKRVPVEVKWQAPLDPDFELVEKSVRPDTVRLRGPESIVSNIETIPTATVTLNATRPGLINVGAGLILDEMVKAEPPEVDVTLAFGIRREEGWIRIPVTVIAPEGVEAEAKPDKIEIKVNAPVTMLRDNKINGLAGVTVRIPKDTPLVSDVFPYDLKLPENVKLIKAVPEQVEIVFKKK